MGQPAASAATGFEPSAQDDIDEPRARPISNRAIAGLVIGVMFIMAVLCLTMALQTQGIRRAHDLGIVKEQEISVPLLVKLLSNLWVLGLIIILYKVWRPRHFGTGSSRPRWALALVVFAAVGVVWFTFLSGPIRHRSSQRPLEEDIMRSVRALRPEQLEALGYLPADSNIVAAVQVAEVLQSPQGKTYLGALRLGPLDFSTNHIEKWTGLTWNDIDQLALAVKLDGMLIPRPTLVVRTVRPYQAEAIVSKLHAVRTPEAARKDCYRFQLEHTPFRPIMWCPPTGHTLVIAFTEPDLSASFEKAAPGIERFPSPLQTLLRERMPTVPLLWLAAYSDQWDKTHIPQWLDRMPVQDREMLLKVRSLGVGLEFDRDVTVSLAAECQDDKSAEAFAGYVGRWAKSALQDVRLLSNGPWVMGQGRGDVAAAQRTLDTSSIGAAP